MDLRKYISMLLLNGSLWACWCSRICSSKSCHFGASTGVSSPSACSRTSPLRSWRCAALTGPTLLQVMSPRCINGLFFFDVLLHFDLFEAMSPCGFVASFRVHATARLSLRSCPCAVSTGASLPRLCSCTSCSSRSCRRTTSTGPSSPRTCSRASPSSHVGALCRRWRFAINEFVFFRVHLLPGASSVECRC